MEDAVARIRAARSAADRILPEFFINARTDVFFAKAPTDSTADTLALALSRGTALVGAGADGVFVPGLGDLESIRTLVAAISRPLNIMRMSESPSVADLAKVGVRRISHGPRPYMIAMEALANASRNIV